MRTVPKFVKLWSTIFAACATITLSAVSLTGASTNQAAEQVPGVAALNTGFNGTVVAVACPARNECSAVGTLSRGFDGRSAVFVASESSGTWQTAKLIGLGRRFGTISAYSCSSQGNCSVGGTVVNLGNSNNTQQAFVANEVKGAWGPMIIVRGTSALGIDGSSVASIFCVANGECALAGSYSNNGVNGAGASEVFVDLEKEGVWGKAVEIPGTERLNTDGNASITALACSSGLRCTVGGSYTTGYGNGSEFSRVFVSEESAGRWGTAIQVPGTAALNTGENAYINSLSCTRDDYCNIAGTYDSSHSVGNYNQEVFVSTGYDGRWRTAIELPGIVKLNTAHLANLGADFCISQGNCVAAGTYQVPLPPGVRGSNQQVFIANEVNGKWHSATAIPSLITLNSDYDAQVSAASCSSKGNCAVVGTYWTVLGVGHQEAFIINEVRGKWGIAKEIPNTGSLNRGQYASVTSLACNKSGNCLVGGSYSANTHKDIQPFVFDEKL